MNKILIENIIFFKFFFTIVISPRNQNAEKNFFKLLKEKEKEKEKIVNVNDDEENFNEEINLQNDNT